MVNLLRQIVWWFFCISFAIVAFERDFFAGADYSVCFCRFFCMRFATAVGRVVNFERLRISRVQNLIKILRTHLTFTSSMSEMLSESISCVIFV